MFLERLKALSPLPLSILLFLAMLLFQIDRSFFLDEGAKHLDFKWNYIAGKCWLNGLSPYNAEHFYAMWERVFHTSANGRPYAYPPTTLLVALPSALFDWDTATKVFNGLNLAAFFGCLLFTGLLIHSNSHYKVNSWRFWVGLTLAASVSMNSVAIYLGQTPFFSLLGCLGALYFAERNRSAASAAFFLLASIKPQLALTPLLLLMLEKPRIFLFGVLITLLFSAGVVALTFESGGLHTLEDSLTTNLKLQENDYAHLVVFYRVLYWLDLSPSRFLIGLIAPGVFLLIWFGLKINAIPTVKMNKLMLISLALTLTSVFSPLHEYDLAILCFSMALVPLLNDKWILAFLPTVILVARPGGLMYLIQEEIGMNPPWTKTELPMYFGSVYLLGALIAYFSAEILAAQHQKKRAI